MSPWLSDALLRTQSDERLVTLTREGHERAFAAIVERYRRPLLAFARNGGPEERAEDVVQQALMSAWAALAAGAEVSHLSGWLHQIVRHETIRAAKRAGRDVHDPLDPAVIAAGAGAESEVEQKLRMRATLAGIADLPEQQREALVQTAVEGRSRSEIAATLGLTEGAVRQLVHRARSTLRTAVTAVTPLPLANWIAAAGGSGGPGVAELAAGAGTATAGGLLLKAGVAVVATGALATGVTVSDRRGAQQRTSGAPAVTQTTGAGAAAAGAGLGGGAASGVTSEPGDDHGGSSGHGSGDDDNSGRGGGDDDNSGHGSGRSGSDDSSGHGSGYSGSSGSGSDDSSGSSGSSGSGSGSSGSGSSGSSGSGGEDDSDGG